MKKREGYRFVILEPAKTRIEEGKCPVCAKPKEEWNRRKDWCCCSTDCTEEFRKKYSVYLIWSELRLKAFERDNFTCVKCGFRVKLEFELDSDYLYCKSNLILSKDSYSTLIGDHIKPIALSGDEWDIDNVQTLCLACNKIKTKQDQIDIAKQRRIDKILLKNKVLK